MTAYQFRAPTWDDFAAVLATLTAYGHDQVNRLLEGEDDLRDRWNSPHITLADDLRIVVDAAGTVAGYIGIATPPPYVNSYPWGFVHPDHYGQGLGTQLLQWAESRARERISDAPDGVRVGMRGEVIWCDERAGRLFNACGFAVTRHFQELVIRFTEQPPAPVFPADVTVRPFNPETDARALAEVEEEVFRDHWGHVQRTPDEAYARMQHRIKSALFSPENWFLALRNDEIVGFSLSDPRVPEDADIAWLLSLGVRRSARKQGIALGLLYHTFTAFHKRGKTGVILGVDTQSLTGAVRLYERAGMTLYQRFAEPEKELRAGRSMETR
ncbi:MAG: GNAT family N-acetyltransferase [Anaerolineae bacterium]|nr:GNAT family N-acetyltransferase [Anaerolineae bacterium]